MFDDGKKNAYPDFYSEEDGIVLDAKYKKLESQNPGRADVYQMISYLHVLKSEASAGNRKAILLYPVCSDCVDCDRGDRLQSVGGLNGLGGKISKLAFFIPPSTAECDFSKYMSKLGESVAQSLEEI